MLRDHTKELVTCLGQFFMAQSRLVDKLEVKARCGTQFNNCRQVKGEDHRVFNLREIPHCATGNRLNFVLFARTLAPVLQRNERDTGVLPTARETKAVYGEYRFNVVFLFGEIVVGHLIQNFLSTLLSCASRQLRHAQEDALVFVRQERTWQTNEQPGHADNDDQVQHQITTGTAQDIAYAIGVVMRALIEHAVKPTEEAGGGAMAAFLDGFQHRGAERRGQNQCHQYRQRHRGNDSDRELTVNRTGRAAEEGHRDKHRGKHHRDTHQRALNLAH